MAAVTNPTGFPYRSTDGPGAVRTDSNAARMIHRRDTGDEFGCVMLAVQYVWSARIASSMKREFWYAGV